MLYVFYNDVDSNPCASLVLAQLENQNVRLVPAGRQLFLFRNKLARIFLHVGWRLKIPFMLNFTREFLHVVKGIKETDSILVFGSGICISPRIAFPFFKVCRAQKKYKWIWDTILTEEDQKWLFELKDNFKVYTFDKSDAQKYGLTYKNTVCALPAKNGAAAFDCDVYFVGYDRGRYELLNGLYEQFTALGLSCNFFVLRDPSSPKEEKALKFAQKRISPEENSENIARTRAVLDIPTKGQGGLTQRTLEGLFLERKVITSNASVKDEKIYNEADVFLLDGRPLQSLPAFIKSPFEPIDAAPYTINEWIKEFL